MEFQLSRDFGRAQYKKTLRPVHKTRNRDLSTEPGCAKDPFAQRKGYIRAVKTIARVRKYHRARTKVPSRADKTSRARSKYTSRATQINHGGTYLSAPQIEYVLFIGWFVYNTVTSAVLYILRCQP